MNIIIPDSWLREYLDTQATPGKIAECLSLCGPSVEKLEKVGKNFIYNLEVTSNRIDAMSVVGIAREATAILNQFKIKATLKNDPYQKVTRLQGYQVTRQIKNLKVVIKKPSLCPRFTAIILENIIIKPSPKIIQERLALVGMRPLNNAIDVSNYLMHQLGQPVHVFDYDKIGKQTMILRESKKDEKLTTLDGKTHTLPGKDIVIEDGLGRLIDLCGIMGGQNSAIDKNTKRILLFVQNYEPTHIRRTSMSLAQRTQAATLFEKAVDTELVIPTILEGIRLLKEAAGATTRGEIIDIYPQPSKQKSLQISRQLIQQRLGTPIKLVEVEKILKSLGFSLKTKAGQLIISVPSWRTQDIDIPEDIIEEIARVYGYHNLPSILPAGQAPQEPNKQTFSQETMIKNTLVDLGFTETYTYSMQSKKQIEDALLKPEKHLKISNPLTEDWVYMRRSLIPSLLSVISQNQSYKEAVQVFELANIYLPRENKLPDERLTLTLALTGDKFYELKGICETLFKKLGIKEKYVEAVGPKIEPPQYLVPSRTAFIQHNHQPSILLGLLGIIKPEVLKNFGISEKVIIADFDFETIAGLTTSQKTYRPISKYPPIIEDLTFILKPKIYIQDLIQLIKECSLIVESVKLVDSYKNSRTLRIVYQHSKRNLTDEEVKEIRNKIIKEVREKFGAELKSR